MNKLYDVLEICLQELEHGVSLENVLARYPDLAGELRPILKASIKARSMAVPAPSPDVIRRGRAKLLQHASEMREAKAAPRKRIFPFFQRLALSLGVAAVFLLSGTGLVRVSASALPGEKLYPVKRTWEDLKLFFTVDQNTRAFVKSEYEIERLHEVSELIAEGRYASIQFVGLFTRLNDMTYISGVPVLLPANMQAPEDGVAVLATGRTNAQGFVELESLELLPDGVFVPLGLPMELELKQETNSNSGSNTNSETNPDPNPDPNSNETPAGGTDSGTGDVPSENSNESGTEHREEFEVKGIVEVMSETTLVVNGKTVYLDNPLIEGNLQNGVKVEIKGYYAEDGRFIVTEVKVKDSVRDDSNKTPDSDSSSNDDDSSDSSDDDSNGNDDSSDSGDEGDDSSDDND